MSTLTKQLKRSLGKKLKCNVSLAEYTRTNVGGKARFLVECTKEKELSNVFALTKKYRLQNLIIGGGTNLLISDDDFNGLVIIDKVSKLKKKGNIVYVSSGVPLGQFVIFVAKGSWQGVEKLAGIPGSVGGAIYGNAGAYGSSTSNFVKRVKIFDGFNITWIDKKDCGFSYRESIFKKTKPIILGAEFEFPLAKNKDVVSLVKETILERAKKYSGKLSCPGSFFKNVEVDLVSPQLLKKIPSEKIVGGKIPAGYLLEEVGAKGLKVGGVEVSDFHANFFLNKGGGKASEYYQLALNLKEKVYAKFGIKLDPEVQLVNFKDNILSFPKIVGVLGLGLEGKDLVNYLLSKKEKVYVLDQKTKKELDLNGIKQPKLSFRLGSNYLLGLSDFDVIYRSPGVYRYIPELIRAEKMGVTISSAVKLFFENCPSCIIAVTGTKGKGTTSTLIYELLKKAGKNVYLIGNIGVSYLELLPKLTKSDYVVMEISSFQLIDLNLSPNIAVVLNITEDHLDWHKDKKEYLKAKENIVFYQTKNDYSVINYDYRVPKSFAQKTEAQIYYFSAHKKVNGSYVENEKIYINTQDKAEEIGQTKDFLLKGKHNWENITAACAVGGILKIDPKIISKVVLSFRGLEHRLEYVGNFKKIDFYNDSFATGPQPTLAAISSFSGSLTVILGGYDKGINFQKMYSEIAKRKNLNIILIGNLADIFEKELKRKRFSGKIVNLGKTDMDKIVETAVRLTPDGGVVVLSPAAASFDMFANYKERGKLFKKAVEKLKK